MTSHEEKRREIRWDFEPPALPDDAPAELRERLELLRPARPPRGVRWLSSLFDRRAVHVTWMRRAFVDKDPAKRRSLRRSMILRVVSAAICWVAFAFDEWWERTLPLPNYLVLPIVYGFALAAFATASWQEAATYRAGWVDGRRAMRDSAEEARDRGMSIGEWWRREQERDWHL